MARIKHIALSTDDPAKTAEFYKKVFGLTELRREPADSGADGVWLSDGYIYFAILKCGGDDTPNLGEGPSTVKGVHHIGFYVDDMEQTCAALEASEEHTSELQSPYDLVCRLLLEKKKKKKK